MSSRPVALLPLAAGAGATSAVRRLLGDRPPGGADRWTRTNHRGGSVSLLEGAAVAAGCATGALAAVGAPARARVAAAGAALSAGGFGAYDDLTGATGSKGFRGHLAALRRGEVTSGIVKLAGIGATGLAAAALVPVAAERRPAGRVLDLVVAGGVVAGSANLANLLDLRPGRALKAGLGAAVVIAAGGGASASLAAAPAGAAVAALPEDLTERGMLGDTGANALGAALGVALAARLGPGGRLAALGALTALTLASERVSFTKVIEATPPLRWLDELGRRVPTGAASAPPAAARAGSSARPAAPGAPADGAAPSGAHPAG